MTPELVSSNFVYQPRYLNELLPAGWHSWFVTSLVRPSFRVQTRPKSVDFHDAENQQRPCRRIMLHVKDP
ncbi:hypothetical protein TNCV_1428021 [Trichonephila clavipes]|nr:hypothetical protein TNCV_1428021 [Trichonephila clavipes]